MANVIHRTTLQYLESVNTPEYPEADWKHNPDLSAVVDVERRYWKAPADWDAPDAGPVEMTPAEKTAQDIADLEASRDAAAEQLDQLENIQRAFMLAVLEEFNRHADVHNAITSAFDEATVVQIQAAIQAIPDVPQRTAAQLRDLIRAKVGV